MEKIGRKKLSSFIVSFLYLMLASGLLTVFSCHLYNILNKPQILKDGQYPMALAFGTVPGFVLGVIPSTVMAVLISMKQNLARRLFFLTLIITSGYILLVALIEIIKIQGISTLFGLPLSIRGAPFAIILFLTSCTAKDTITYWGIDEAIRNLYYVPILVMFLVLFTSYFFNKQDAD